jgi:hypothetical protein
VWKILTNLDIILAWDPRWRDRLWLNDLGHAMMLDGEPITDTTISNIRVAIQFDYEHDWGNENVFDRVKAACTARRVNPVSSYLRSLTWDGEGRLDHMDDYLSMPANQDLDLKRAYLRKFMIGAVARIMAPGCKMDTMLVLYSKRQGVGKSRFAAARLYSEWFAPVPALLALVARSRRPADRFVERVISGHARRLAGGADGRTRSIRYPRAERAP